MEISEALAEYGRAEHHLPIHAGSLESAAFPDCILRPRACLPPDRAPQRPARPSWPRPRRVLAPGGAPRPHDAQRRRLPGTAPGTRMAERDLRPPLSFLPAHPRAAHVLEGTSPSRGRSPGAAGPAASARLRQEAAGLPRQATGLRRRYGHPRAEGDIMSRDGLFLREGQGRGLLRRPHRGRGPRSGRALSDVELLAVTKFHPIEAVRGGLGRGDRLLRREPRAGGRGQVSRLPRAARGGCAST